MARVSKNLSVGFAGAGLILFLLSCGMADAQVSVFSDNYDVDIGSENSASNLSGEIAGDVEIEGVAVINEKVYIDGVGIAKGTKEVVSRKTGKVYRIDWGKDGNVTITEK